jgi:hypothetical protein
MRRMAVVVPAALVASLLAAWHAGAVSVYYAFGGPGGVVTPGPASPRAAAGWAAPPSAATSWAAME